MLHSLSSARLCSACSKLPSRDEPERPVAMSPGVFVRTFFGSHIAPRLLACFPTSMACSKGGMFGARKRTPARACPHERFQVWCRLPPDDYGVCSSSEALGIRAFNLGRWDRAPAKTRLWRGLAQDSHCICEEPSLPSDVPSLSPSTPPAPDITFHPKIHMVVHR